MTELVSVRVS